MSVVFLKIVNMSITASWLILAVLFARLLLKKAPKRITCFLWGLVAVRLIFPFSIESVISLIPSRNETIPLNIAEAPSPAVNSGVPIIDNTVNPVISDSLAPAVGDSANPLQIIIPIIAALWIAGILAMLAYALISYLRLRKSVSASILLRDNIYMCDSVKSPFILGVIKPKIYIPSSMNEETSVYVLKHETAHISRRDYLWKPFGYLLLAVYWFTPLCWLSYILFCRDIELACDEKVVRNMDKDEKTGYSQALLECSMPRKAISACPVAFGETGVKTRIKSVLNYKKPAFRIIIVSLVLCAVVAVCFLTDPKSKKSTPLSDNMMIEASDLVFSAHNDFFWNDSYNYNRLIYNGTLYDNYTVDYDVVDIGHGWTKAGVLEKFELTDENFDNCFKDESFYRDIYSYDPDQKTYHASGFSADSIRKNNVSAERILSKTDFTSVTYILKQKNGDILYCAGVINQENVFYMLYVIKYKIVETDDSFLRDDLNGSNEVKEDEPSPYDYSIKSILYDKDRDYNDRIEAFYEYENNQYCFPSEMSNYVIVEFNNKEKMNIVDALNKHLANISDLDKFDIPYSIKSVERHVSNPDIVRIYLDKSLDYGDDAFEEFYQDEKYVYQLSTGGMKDCIFVEFKNGSRIALPDALNDGVIQISDLDAYGFYYSKYPKSEMPSD